MLHKLSISGLNDVRLKKTQYVTCAKNNVTFGLSVFWIAGYNCR